MSYVYISHIRNLATTSKKYVFENFMKQEKITNYTTSFNPIKQYIHSYKYVKGKPILFIMKNNQMHQILENAYIRLSPLYRIYYFLLSHIRIT